MVVFLVLLGYFLSEASSATIEIGEFDYSVTPKQALFTSSLFEIDLYVEDPEFVGLEIEALLYDSVSKETANFSGPPTCLIEELGSCVFYDLQISQSGSFFFSFKLGDSFVSSDIFQVLPGLTSIVLNSTFTEPSAFISFQIELYVLDSNQNLWTEETIEFNIESSSKFFGKYNFISGLCEGKTVIKTFVQDPGDLAITAKAGSLKSGELKMKIRKNKLKFLKDINEVRPMQDLDVEKAFDVEIGVFDENLRQLAENDCSSSVKLEVPGVELLGEKVVKVKNGVAKFSDIVIPRNGSFSFVAASDGRDSVYFPTEVVVKNLPLAFILLEVDESVVSYFYFSVNFKLFNRNWNIVQDPYSLNLFANASLFGQNELVVDNGSGSFRVYLKETGNIKLNIYSNHSLGNNTEIVAKSPDISIEPRGVFYGSSNYFNLSLSLQNEDQKIENLAELFIVDLSLLPEGRVYGDLKNLAINNRLEIPNIVILSEGIFAFKATIKNSFNDFVISEKISDKQYLITQQQVHLPKFLQDLTAVLIASQNKQTTAFFDINLEVLLIDQIGDLYKKKCDLGVIGNMSVYGNTYLTTSSGKSSFIIHSRDLGKLKLMTTACGTLSNYTEVEILPLVPDLKITENITEERNSFNVTVTLLDHFREKTEDKNGLYDIELFLKPNGTLSGQCSISKTKGFKVFQNLKIESPGSFAFYAKITESQTSQAWEISSGDFQIPEFVPTDLTNFPIIVIISLIWILITLGVVFYISDHNYFQTDTGKGPLHQFCPLLIMNNPGPNHIRIVTALRVFFSQFLLIGLTLWHFFRNPKQLEISVQLLIDTVWVLGVSAGISFPMSLLHYFLLSSRPAALRIGIFNLILILFSASTGVYLMQITSQTTYETWICCFAFFSMLDFLLHNVYGLLFYLLFYKKPKSEMLSQKLLPDSPKDPKRKINFEPFKSPQGRPLLTSILSPSVDIKKLKLTSTPSMRKYFNFDDASVRNKSISQANDISSISNPSTNLLA